MAKRQDVGFDQLGYFSSANLIFKFTGFLKFNGLLTGTTHTYVGCPFHEPILILMFWVLIMWLRSDNVCILLFVRVQRNRNMLVLVSCTLIINHKTGTVKNMILLSRNYFVLAGGCSCQYTG